MKSFVLFVAAALAAVFTGEIYCRLFLPLTAINNPYALTKIIGEVQPGKPYSTYTEIYPLEFDPRGYYAKSAGRIFYSSNQVGARWIDVSPQKIDEETVIFLGDSFAYGFGLRYEDTFVYQLQPKSSASFLNFAMPGSDIRFEEQTYKEVAAKLPHRLVFLGLSMNDLIEFPTSKIISPPPLPGAIAQLKIIEFITGRIDQIFGRRERIDEILNPSNIDKPFFQSNFQALKNIASQAKKSGRPFVVIIFPVLVDLKRGSFTPLYERITRSLAAAHIDFIDLTASVTGHEDESLWITPFDQHPNEIANALFAEDLRKLDVGKFLL